MEYLTMYNMTDPKLQQFAQALLQRINFEAPQDKMGTRVKVLLGLYLASLQKTGIGLRDLRTFVDKDPSTIWRHIAEFEEAAIATQIKRGKWTLTHPTLTATLANALDRVINEFNIALAYAKNIDEKFGQTTQQTLPIWVKLWIKPLAFTNTTDEENTITSPNQPPTTKTTTKTARPTINKPKTTQAKRGYLVYEVQPGFRFGVFLIKGAFFWFCILCTTIVSFFFLSFFLVLELSLKSQLFCSRVVL
jgi:hypothetical protein